MNVFTFDIGALMLALTAFLAAAIQSGTPLLFATLGETITEKSGNLNLGVEGMMLLGAVIGFVTGLYTGSPVLALIGAMLAGGGGAAVYAFLTVSLRANQVVSGLTLSIFGAGVSSFMGQSLIGKVVPQSVQIAFHALKIPLLGDIPYIGQILFTQDLFVYFGYLCAVVCGFYLYNTRLGLNLRAIGENPASADAAGIRITLYKYVHIILGGALCGLGGAYLSLVYVPSWQDNITAGRGWIAVALVIFTAWNPYKALYGAFLFGGLDILGFRLQSLNLPISQFILDMTPYVVTILVLLVTSIRKSKNASVPLSLGNPYFREDR